MEQHGPVEDRHEDIDGYTGARGFAAQLDREVEVLRPQLHARGLDIVSGRHAQLFQDRGGEPVPVAQEGCSDRVDVEPLAIELDIVGK